MMESLLRVLRQYGFEDEMIFTSLDTDMNFQTSRRPSSPTRCWSTTETRVVPALAVLPSCIFRDGTNGADEGSGYCAPNF